jgi:hypothetical protein
VRLLTPKNNSAALNDYLINHLSNVINPSLDIGNIPNHLLQTNQTYKIGLKLCNQLKQCDSMNITVNVVDPSEIISPQLAVQIAGDSVRQINRLDALTLTGSAWYQSCGQILSKNIRYRWLVDDAEESSSSKSITFKSRSLITGRHRVVLQSMLVVGNKVVSQSISSAVIVVVSAAPLVARISPSYSTMMIRLGETAMIHGTNSVDYDSDSPSSVLLDYSWLCLAGNCQYLQNSSLASNQTTVLTSNILATTSSLQLSP